MKLSKLYHAALVAALLIGVVACGEDPLPTGPTIINQNTIIIGAPPSPNPSPGASPGPGLGFDSIRIGIFGHREGCKNPPRNGENTVRLGCTADATATPKLAGVDVPATVHGGQITWFLNGQRVDGVASNAVVRVTIQTEPFNVALDGLAAGSFTLDAEVKGFRDPGGPKGFTVQ